MWHDLGTVALAATLPPASAWGWRSLFALFRWPFPFIPGWISAAVGGVGISLIQRDWPYFIGALASLLIALAIRWWRSDKRRKAAALIGAKSRAILAAIVRKSREALKPRPVLKPSLRGI